jgi:hypothetical protein
MSHTTKRWQLKPMIWRTGIRILLIAEGERPGRALMIAFIWHLAAKTALILS